MNMRGAYVLFIFAVGVLVTVSAEGSEWCGVYICGPNEVCVRNDDKDPFCEEKNDPETETEWCGVYICGPNEVCVRNDDDDPSCEEKNDPETATSESLSYSSSVTTISDVITKSEPTPIDTAETTAVSDSRKVTTSEKTLNTGGKTIPKIKKPTSLGISKSSETTTGTYKSSTLYPTKDISVKAKVTTDNVKLTTDNMNVYTGIGSALGALAVVAAFVIYFKKRNPRILSDEAVHVSRTSDFSVSLPVGNMLTV